jgi:hypothetical protein
MSELLPSTFDCTTCGPVSHFIHDTTDAGNALALCPTCRSVLTRDESLIETHEDSGIDPTASLDELDRTELDALSTATAAAVKRDIRT